MAFLGGNVDDNENGNRNLNHVRITTCFRIEYVACQDE